MSAARKLGKAVNNKSDGFKQGTVVAWESYNEERDVTYTYVAVKAGPYWWLTGIADFYGKRVLSYDELTSILAREDVINIRVAKEWEPV